MSSVLNVDEFDNIPNYDTFHKQIDEIELKYIILEIIHMYDNPYKIQHFMPYLANPVNMDYQFNMGLIDKYNPTLINIGGEFS